VELHIKGQRKTFCTWVNYTTKLYWQDVYFKLALNLDGAPSPQESWTQYWDDYSSDNNEWNHTYTDIVHIPQGQYVQWPSSNMLSFSKAHVEGWTQGTTSNFSAKIDCD